MAFLAFPLRLEKSFLARCEEPEAVVSLLRVMARTPHGSWAGCRRFGVRDLFEQARGRSDLPELAAREINLALEDLGIRRFRVAAITPETEAEQETQSYVLTLASTEEAGKSWTLNF